MLLSDGSVAIFWSNALVGSVSALALVMLLWPLWGTLKGKLFALPARPA
jgi:putative tricarboxylic transport membrane protein